MVAITGQVARAVDRHGRLPGGRHPRHHAADHQAQLPGADGRGDPAGPGRGVPPGRAPAGPARCWSTSPRTCCRRRPTFTWPPTLDLPGYRPTLHPHGKQIREAARLIADGPPAGALRRRRRAQGRRRRGAAQAGRADRHPGGHHADGPRRVPRLPPAAPGHARHARHGRRGLRAAEGRPADRARRPVRRPGHRQAGHVRPGRADRARRHRPGRDRQEPGRRRADRRRRQARHRRADRARSRPSTTAGHRADLDRLVAPARRPARTATRWATRSRPTARSPRST